MTSKLNWNSRQLTHGWQRGVTAFYYGLGFDQEDFSRAQIGIGVPLLEGNLCNVHAYELGQALSEGCTTAGMIGLPFGVPGISDNLTQGQEGGNGSLPSRNLIANSAECVVTAHHYDAMIGLHHCDKNGPGFAMALARMNYPGLVVSGGSIRPGCHRGQDTSILDVYDSQAAAMVGNMSEEEAEQILKTACPGPGGCGIAASFNTWGVTLEAIGLMLPYSSSIPAEGSGKREECLGVGAAIRNLLEQEIRPRDILTKKAFENAAVTMAAMGGSTNGVLHLLAFAIEAQVDFGLSELQAIFRKTPVICNFAPRGKRTMYDLHKMGGTPLILRRLLDMGLLDGTCMTVTGKCLEENLQDVPQIPEDQDLIAPINTPFKEYADIQVCFGNLAPKGIVFKVSSMQSPHFEGTAICFDDAREVLEAVEAKKILPGHVIVLRYLGPAASGMPEVLVATAALSVPELDGKVALISDTRVSGVSHGAIGVHCSPEAHVGGPIALVKDGDPIQFDLLEGTLHWEVSDEEFQQRQANWKPLGANRTRGYLADFCATVAQADRGCVSRAMYPDP
ncbi:MAG: dihydroxy-acid dehydratase [Planctomycetota bacterium]|nr:dihydroxy-acid dehydratase [Planctomycetota bacterium]MEC8432525.1 dihydroxy-acid dehydratase [Planctomycetota bacterium]MEC8862032.1 dihydroxy-acid dehydratase [Planctomycetota bacterium]